MLQKWPFARKFENIHHKNYMSKIAKDAIWMNFYIPACAREAYTVSLGNAKSSTNTKPKSSGHASESDYETMLKEAQIVDILDPDPVSCCTFVDAK